MVVAMIDGACVFGRIIDDMTVDDGPSRVCLVHVLSRQHRQRQRRGDCTHGHGDSDGSGFQHERSVYRVGRSRCQHILTPLGDIFL